MAAVFVLFVTRLIGKTAVAHLSRLFSTIPPEAPWFGVFACLPTLYAMLSDIRLGDSSLGRILLGLPMRDTAGPRSKQAATPCAASRHIPGWARATFGSTAPPAMTNPPESSGSSTASIDIRPNAFIVLKILKSHRVQTGQRVSIRATCAVYPPRGGGRRPTTRHPARGPARAHCHNGKSLGTVSLRRYSGCLADPSLFNPRHCNGLPVAAMAHSTSCTTGWNRVCNLP